MPAKTAALWGGWAVMVVWVWVWVLLLLGRIIAICFWAFLEAVLRLGIIGWEEVVNCRLGHRKCVANLLADGAGDVVLARFVH